MPHLFPVPIIKIFVIIRKAPIMESMNFITENLWLTVVNFHELE